MATYNSVWDALFDDKKKESYNLKIRSALMSEIEDYIKKSNLSQTKIAEKLGCKQPRISNLVNGKIANFSLDCLVNMLAELDATYDFYIQKQEEKIEEKKEETNYDNVEYVDFRKRAQIQRSRQRQEAFWEDETLDTTPPSCVNQFSLA